MTSREQRLIVTVLLVIGGVILIAFVASQVNSAQSRIDRTNDQYCPHVYPDGEVYQVHC